MRQSRVVLSGDYQPIIKELNLQCGAKGVQCRHMFCYYGQSTRLSHIQSSFLKARWADVSGCNDINVLSSMAPTGMH